MQKERKYGQASATVLVIEVSQTLIGDGSVVWTVTLSRAGREGTFEKRWHNKIGVLSAPQEEDLTRWVQTSVHNCLMAWGGVQGVLET